MAVRQFSLPPSGVTGPAAPAQDPGHLWDETARPPVAVEVRGEEIAAADTSCADQSGSGGSDTAPPGWPDSRAEMSTQSWPGSQPSHLIDSRSLMRSAQQERAELKTMSVRGLIAELAHLEEASRSSSPLFSDVEDHNAWPRTREGRIIAELRRRHAALRRWALPDLQAASNRGGDPPPDGAAVRLPGHGARLAVTGEEKSCPA